MMIKKIIIPILTGMLVFISNFRVMAQSDDISKITEQIKVSYELEKLNDCRIKLRAIEFSQLKTKEEKEQYAEAYRQLALAFRNHRYSRPAYDIYQKYLSLRDTILEEEKSKLISQTLKKHADLHASVLDEITTAENEKKKLLNDKSTLDSLKKNNFRYSIFFSVVLLAAFTFILIKYNNKLKAAKSSLYGNRRNIFEKSNEVTKGQMALGVINRLKFLNEDVSAEIKNAGALHEITDRELKAVKEAEQPLKNLKENISQIRQLSEISAKTIANVLQKISGT
jgi:hypothetical protein